MDPEYLAGVLSGTYNPNKSIRDPAEAALKTALETPGCSLAFAAILDNSVDKRYRQAAGIAIKNNIRSLWSKVLGAEEKSAFRERLLAILLAETDDSIRDIVGEVLRCIAETELHDQR